jgi:hypothetical protein
MDTRQAMREAEILRAEAALLHWLEAEPLGAADGPGVPQGVPPPFAAVEPA